ncbi:hypothetical protein AB4Y43_18295 [Paraburkholderia sp. BR10872]|uniref:hypothetical protein n=1 Tax=Paraburkholderia sp. BR10872 TaxID=3236989 RepID=UPI0034D1B3E8
MDAPLIIEPAQMRLYRTVADCADIFGERHATALFKLVELARKQGQGIAVTTLPDGRGGEALVAKALGVGDWACVK